MKIGLVIRRFSADGGAERACMYLASGLVARGHEVHAFAARLAPMKGVELHEVKADTHASFAMRSKEALEPHRGSLDVIHSFTRTSYQDVLRLGGGIHKEYLTRTDPTYSAIGRWWRRVRPKEKAELRLEQESFKKGSYRKIVAVSHRVREETIRHYTVPGQDRSRILNPCMTFQAGFKQIPGLPDAPQQQAYDKTIHEIKPRHKSEFCDACHHH